MSGTQEWGQAAGTSLRGGGGTCWGAPELEGPVQLVLPVAFLVWHSPGFLPPHLVLCFPPAQRHFHLQRHPQQHCSLGLRGNSLPLTDLPAAALRREGEGPSGASLPAGGWGALLCCAASPASPAKLRGHTGCSLVPAPFGQLHSWWDVCGASTAWGKRRVGSIQEDSLQPRFLVGVWAKLEAWGGGKNLHSLTYASWVRIGPQTSKGCWRLEFLRYCRAARLAQASGPSVHASCLPVFHSSSLVRLGPPAAWL